MLINAPTLAIGGFDTAANEPSKVLFIYIFFARRGLSNLNENRENMKTKREPPSFNYYCGESSNNSVVCGCAGSEFSLEVWGWSSDVVWYAWAKRLKVNWEILGSVVLPFLEC